MPGMRTALVLNTGSSSVKARLYRIEGRNWPLLARAEVEPLGTENPVLTLYKAETRHTRTLKGRPALVQVVRTMMEALGGTYAAEHIAICGHRIVHGGTFFTDPVQITGDVLARLHGLDALAPLHQPHNLKGVECLMGLLPNIPQVAVFDTAFHRGRDRLYDLFAIPRALTEKGVLRYGFHGLSYDYISGVLPDVVGHKGLDKVVVAHLGNGASVCAIKNGRAVDSSMGFTALDGLVMGTRCGAIDPGVVLYLQQTLGYTPQQVTDMLYRQSGLLGVSGISGDVRTLEQAAADDENNENAALALELFAQRAAREISAMACALGGLETLVFTGGIGENGAAMRGRIAARLAFLGVAVESGANLAQSTTARRISPAKNPVACWVVPTDEERVIARACATFLKA